MDRKTPILLNDSDCVSPQSEAEDLLRSKQRLIQAAREIDPLGAIRRHPAVLVGTAAALGAIAATPRAREYVHRSWGQFAPRLVQLAGNTFAMFLEQRQRAASRANANVVDSAAEHPATPT